MSKEDKIIKDLKERNRSLNNQFRLRDIRVNILEQREIEKDKEIERLKKLVITLSKNIQELSCNEEELELLNNILGSGKK